MKRVHLLLAATILLASCGSSNSQPQNNVSIQHVQQQPANVQAQVNDVPGFDIPAFSALLKQTANPDAIQQAINAPGNSINNLDLDNDGNIDYLKVDQQNATTLQVVDEVGNDPNQRTVIATLNINQQNNSYSVTGSQDYSGNNYVYQSAPGISFGQLLFLSWMLSPSHAYYHPYWGYHRGYYRGYSSYHSHYSTPYNRGYMQQRRTYRTTTTTTTNNRPQQQQRVQQNQPRQAVPQQRASVAAPQQSQRQYQVNTNNTGGHVNSGFGGAKTNTGGGSRSSFGSSRSSGFGGGSSHSSSHSSGRRH